MRDFLSPDSPQPVLNESSKNAKNVIYFGPPGLTNVKFGASKGAGVFALYAVHQEDFVEL